MASASLSQLRVPRVVWVIVRRPCHTLGAPLTVGQVSESVLSDFLWSGLVNLATLQGILGLFGFCVGQLLIWQYSGLAGNLQILRGFSTSGGVSRKGL